MILDTRNVLKVHLFFSFSQRRRKLEAERLAIEEEMRLTAQMGRGAAKREAERRLQVQISHSTFIIISSHVIVHSSICQSIISKHSSLSDCNENLKLVCVKLLRTKRRCYF